jgi:hypothetical protein
VEHGIRKGGGGAEGSRRWQNGARVIWMTYGQLHGPIFVARRCPRSRRDVASSHGHVYGG